MKSLASDHIEGTNNWQMALIEPEPNDLRIITLLQELAVSEDASFDAEKFVAEAVQANNFLRMIALEKDEVLIALAILSPSELQESENRTSLGYELLDFVVAKTWRRKAVGRWFFIQLRQRFEGHLRWGVITSNETALKFYRQVAFAVPDLARSFVTPENFSFLSHEPSACQFHREENRQGFTLHFQSDGTSELELGVLPSFDTSLPGRIANLATFRQSATVEPQVTTDQQMITLCKETREQFGAHYLVWSAGKEIPLEWKKWFQSIEGVTYLIVD